MRRTAFLALFAVAIAAGQNFSNSAIRTNPGFANKSVPRNDDGSAPLESLGFTINFFGKLRTQGYVNNNGNITFDSALSTYTPFGLDSTQREIIAPFFSDVDTRPAGSKLVTYGRDTVDGRAAFGANYLDVGYYNQHADKLNRFQVVLIDRSDTGAGNFDIEFNYSRILWETGDASGGSGGFGGVPAAVGWSNGTGEAGTSFQLDGSLIAGSFLDSGPQALVRQRLNSNVTGRLLFRARDGKIIPPLTILTGCPLPDAALNVPYSQQMNGTGGGTNYRWALVTDPGTSFVPGLSLGSNGVLSGTPTAVGTTGFTVQLTVQTETGDQTVSRRCSITVDPPQLTIASGCPLPSGTVGKAYRTALQVRGGRTPYTWSLPDATLAPGLSLSSDGTVAGTPTAEGTYYFTLAVNSNSADNANPATKSCTVTVNPAELDLTSSCTLPKATSGVPYSQNLTVSGGTAPYNWSVQGALPVGLYLDQSGRITGTASSASSSAFTATVTDARGRTISQNCQLTVTNPQIAISTTCPLPKGTAGRAYNQSLSASGGTGPYSWSVLGALPPGITLSGDGKLSGIPMNTGAHTFRLLASDANGQAVTTSCALDVLPADFFSPSCPLPMGTVGIPYSQSIRAVGGVGPYIFSTSSPLPSGVTLNSFGYVSGTPDRAGSYPVTIHIQDSAGASTNQACNLTIQPSPVQINASCPLPNGQVGVPYTAAFTASGGTAPYRFSVEGNLPAGLTLGADGKLTGTPTSEADRSFNIRVSDAQGVQNVIDCAVSVDLPAIPRLSFTQIPASFAPASTGPTITLQLGQKYALPIQGRLRLTVTPDTGQALGSVNQADPRLKFANGQTVFNFTIPAGSTSTSITIPSTGTVASKVTVTAENLTTASNPIPLGPSPAVFQVARTAPVLTDACYTNKTTGAELTITGYSTTRSLTTAAITYNSTLSGAATQNLTLDISGSASDYFASDDSIRNGGAFTVTFPFTNPGVTVSNVSVGVSNSVGSAASRTVSACK